MMQRKEELKEAFEIALNYLQKSFRPSGKVKEKLLQKGCAPSVVEAALFVLEKKGYLKDETLAKLYVEENALSFQAEGKQALGMRMKKLGYSTKAIQNALLLYKEEQALCTFLKNKCLREMQILYDLWHTETEEKGLSPYETAFFYSFKQEKEYKKILQRAYTRTFSLALTEKYLQHFIKFGDLEEEKLYGEI